MAIIKLISFYAEHNAYCMIIVVMSQDGIAPDIYKIPTICPIKKKQFTFQLILISTNEITSVVMNCFEIVF